jgi:hypothetical protein
MHVIDKINIAARTLEQIERVARLSYVNEQFHHERVRNLVALYCANEVATAVSNAGPV